MCRIVPTLVFLAVAVPAPAQLRNPLLDPRYVDSEQVFDSTELARIDLTMTEADYQFLLADPAARIEVPADMRFRNVHLDETLQSVGVRFRGGTSINLRKHSWDIDFNHFIEGQRFHGLRQFNVNSHHNDPSILRGHLMLEFCRREGIPAPRSHLCDLHLHTTGPGGITGRFLGTFVNTEQIDGTFLRAWYSENDGPLYKCTFPANLTVLGDGASEDYAVPQYELADDNDGAGRGPLAAFIRALSEIPGNQFEAQFPLVFDVDTYLRSLAVETAFGHWDGHWANQNNFFLYHIPPGAAPGTGLIQFITYDVDNVMEVNFTGTDTATVAPLNFGTRSTSNRPLPNRVLAVTAWRNRYLQILSEWYRDEFTPVRMAPEIARLRDLIAPSILADLAGENHYGDQWGFDFDDFLDSVNGTGGVAFFVRRGVFEYVSVRSQYETPSGLFLWGPAF